MTPQARPRHEGIDPAEGRVDSGSLDLDHEWDGTLYDRFPNQGIKTTRPSALRGGGQGWASRSPSLICTFPSPFTQCIRIIIFMWALTCWEVLLLEAMPVRQEARW